MFCALVIVFLLYNGIFSDYTLSRSTDLGRVNFLKPPRKRSIVSLIFSYNNNMSTTRTSNGDKNVSTNVTPACRWLRGFKYQNKMCRKRKGLPQALLIAKHLAVVSCKEQFRFDRWNCSFKKSMFKKIYRETAFMHAISGAAIAYTIARACSDGDIQNCRCARPEGNESPKFSWKWGACGDNTEQGIKITRKFMQIKQNKDLDNYSTVLNYNTEIGFTALPEVEMKVCTCHGVSASCVMKTCWKRLPTFRKVAEKLKNRYHSALLLVPGNNVKERMVKKTNSRSNLVYFEQSPSFCHSTAGRECKDEDNCATLCCGRGFEVHEVLQQKQCRCHWKKCCFDVTCDTCNETVDVYKCK